MRNDDDDSGDDWPDDGDDDVTVPCPYCKKEISEDAERFPYCENYISAEDMPAASKPWWIVVGIVLSFIVAYFWVTGR